MIRITFIIVTLMSFMHCDSSSKDVVTECAPNPNQAILIRKGCEAYVFQLTQPSLLTQADWKDIFTKKSYQNVLSVLNYCDDTPESKILQSLNAGDKVTMQLVSTQDHCLQLCFAFEDAPGKSYKASEINICLQ